MVKRIFLLPLFAVTFLLSGCWDKVELNEIAIVSGITIEKGENARYKVTVSAINSAEQSKTSAMGNTPSVSYSLEGDSVSELSQKMNVGVSRKLIYSHTRVLVIDEAVAREGLLEFLDFLERSGEFRNDFNILIAREGEAQDILKITYPIQKDPSLKIHDQAQALHNEWGGDPGIRLTDFITTLILEGKHAVAAAVKVKGDPEKGSSVENNKKIDLDALIEFDGLAVFNFDKLVGFLSLEDARSYLWTEDLEQTELSVPCNEEKDKFIDIKVISTSTKKETEFKNGKAELVVNVIGEADLVGTQCTDPLDKIDTFNKYEKLTEKFIEKNIKETITKTQEKYKVDIFGFGDTLNRSNHKEFKKIKYDWDQYFSEASLTVKANIFLRRSGIRNKSFLTDLEKYKERAE
ncbi:Ger(x)C family spore germination protein [Neobacillus sp. D3-1R]|uniref:Ger(x)C family spore germination protein n=1 Tax=Neobacillus sp. D3-1R TaxID=3445778 RepID=UPI003FA00F89